jgi:poly [ADP-ribose] polymerase
MRDVTIPTCTDVAAFLQYNEYIVYDAAQIRQRYLFYIKMT